MLSNQYISKKKEIINTLCVQYLNIHMITKEKRLTSDTNKYNN